MKIKPIDTALRKKYPEEIALIRGVAPQLISILNLEDWKIDVNIKESSEKDEDEPTGACSANPAYRSAELDFYVGTMHDQEDDLEQLDTIIHEFLHVFLSPTLVPIRTLLDEKGKALTDYLEEELVTRIAGNLQLWPSLLA